MQIVNIFIDAGGQDTLTWPRSFIQDNLILTINIDYLTKSTIPITIKDDSTI